MRSAESRADNADESNTPHAEGDAPHVEHVTVLLREAVDLLAPRSRGVYVDGTAGAGGHAEEILRRSSPDGRLIGLDRDDEAVARCRARLEAYGGRVTLRQANFREIPAVLAELGIEAVDGVLLDLGVSTYHLRTPPG